MDTIVPGPVPWRRRMLVRSIVGAVGLTTVSLFPMLWSGSTTDRIVWASITGVAVVAACTYCVLAFRRSRVVRDGTMLTFHSVRKTRAIDVSRVAVALLGQTVAWPRVGFAASYFPLGWRLVLQLDDRTLVVPPACVFSWRFLRARSEAAELLEAWGVVAPVEVFPPASKSFARFGGPGRQSPPGAWYDPHEPHGQMGPPATGNLGEKEQ